MAKPKKTMKAARATKRPTVELAGNIPKLTLSMPLDQAKIKAIQRCIEKGTLTISVSKVDLATGRSGEGWLYD